MKPLITVLLATYNGEKYLREQLDSIFSQTYQNIKVFARDDGSSDGTLAILEEYSKTHNLKYVKGENLGAFQNFLEIIKIAPDSDIYAYSDQDDVWVPEKLEIAEKAISEAAINNKPTIFIHSNYSVNNNLEIIDQPNVSGFSEANNLALAIVRNICQGSACVFNDKLMSEIRKRPDEFVIQHDWWTYLVCVAIGGNVIAEPKPLILYRQHGNNVLGSHIGVMFRLRRRFKMIFERSDHNRVRLCKEILKCYPEKLSEKSTRILTRVASYQSSFIDWMKFLFDRDFYHNVTVEYKISFFFAILTRTV